MKDIFRLHGVRKKVISDKDAKFTSNLWKTLFAGLETQLNFSTSYYLETRWTNQTY